jgi:hypothetical protein
MSQIVRQALAVSAAVLGLESGLGAQSASPEVPGALIRWSREIEARGVLFGAGSVFVQTQGALIALDGETGQQLWEQPLGNEESPRRPADPMILLEGKIVVGVGHRVSVFDGRTGSLVSRVEVLGGAVRFIAGPPLVVETEWRLSGSVILRIDPDTGKTLTRQRSNLVMDISIHDGVLLVRADRSSPKEAPELHTLSGFRASDLKLLWSIRGDWPELHVVDGVSVLGVSADHDRGRKYMPINLQTGDLAPPLPKRGPVEAEWGGATWELESVDSGDNFDRMRRNDSANGGAVWTRDIPFPVTGFLRDRTTLYLYGGDGLAVLDWGTGSPRQILRTFQHIRELFVFTNSLVAWTFDDRIISFTLSPAV